MIRRFTFEIWRDLRIPATGFLFDRGQAEEHRKDGVNAMHLPLAVDAEVFRINASKREKEDYRTDISLVGKLYQTEYSYLRHRYRAI